MPHRRAGASAAVVALISSISSISASCAEADHGGATADPVVAVTDGGPALQQLQHTWTPEIGAPPGGPDRALLEPADGTYFGASLDLAADSPAAFDERLGHDAADFVAFVDFPMGPADEAFLDDFLERVAEQRAMALITLEPQVPLADITAATADDLALRLGAANLQRDVCVLVRFAHEMNGSWYPWGQQPIAYVDAFRRVAEAIHREAPCTAMLWAPNYGGGYPFGGGEHLARPGDPGFEVLDTDQDGALTDADDPYLPYYPGDAHVDWVGFSLYHWGSSFPWGDNEIPEPRKFVEEITGTYDGLAGDQTDVPDFYATFVEQRGKPMAIAETGALYSPDRGGAGELDIKSAWWNQVFDPEVAERFPRLRMVNWFEMYKRSSEVGGATIDWTVTFDPTIREAFLEDLPVDRLIFAPIEIAADR